MRHYVDRTLRRTRCGSVYGPVLSLRNQWTGYELFSGTFGISQYINWNITLSSEQWNWKEVGEIVCALISGVGGPRKTTKPSVRIDGVMAEILNGNLPNIPANQTPYWLSHGFSMVSYRLFLCSLLFVDSKQVPYFSTLCIYLITCVSLALYHRPIIGLSSYKWTQA